MPKLNAEELEALQKSDPAAFDMDDEGESPSTVTQQVVADPADADDDTAERPRDENGRFVAKDKQEDDTASSDDDANAAAAAQQDDPPAPQPKTNMVPEPRLAEVVAERNAERERAKALEREAEELRAKLAEATKAPARDFAAEKEALEQAYDDGDISLKDYNAKRDEILVAEVRATLAADREREQAEARQREAEKAQKSAAEQYDAARVKFFSDESNVQLANTKVKEMAFRAAIDEVFEAGTAKTYDEVFVQAAEKVRAEFGIGGKQAAVDPHAERKARDAANASAASATPAQVRGGVGNRGSAAAALDVSRMKPGSFSKLPKDQQEALLGEGAV